MDEYGKQFGHKTMDEYEKQFGGCGVKDPRSKPGFTISGVDTTDRLPRIGFEVRRSTGQSCDRLPSLE
ncbi:hypothetical protein Bpfe_015457 [Biomphalaria pfeifferi]|uniref:Uncharacterized protein n=1 Tax=Biomphalaria pfeifferi TaxID=112525 RepID=A0AAD8BIF7_BIOPF|nr:hypothetical protein Bpfe_015457 [Biomphalaria pfeifferi]